MQIYRNIFLSGNHFAMGASIKASVPGSVHELNVIPRYPVQRKHDKFSSTCPLSQEESSFHVNLEGKNHP